MPFETLKTVTASGWSFWEQDFSSDQNNGLSSQLAVHPQQLIYLYTLYSGPSQQTTFIYQQSINLALIDNFSQQKQNSSAPEQSFQKAKHTSTFRIGTAFSTLLRLSNLLLPALKVTWSYASGSPNH